MHNQRTDTEHASAIARLRRTLLLLANNQETEQQREVAGRHLAALHAAMMGVRRDDGRHTDTEREEGTRMMTEQQLDDLARMAAQHIHEQHVADPEGDDAVWEARLGRAIALAIRDALAAHEHRFLHLRGND